MADYTTALFLTFLAGLATMVGAIIALSLKKISTKHLCLGMGFSAGVMLYVAFVELFGTGIKEIGYLPATIGFFTGMILIAIIDIFIPHEYQGEKGTNTQKRLMRLGILITLGIIIHNLPEGTAVFFSYVSSIKFGISVAFAIAMHNIPEGIAIALPIFYATKKKATAYIYSLAAAISEPVGALLALIVLFKFLNGFIIYFVLSLVSGVMVFIVFDELLPQAYEYKDRHTILAGVVGGMLVMALSLYFM
ncbi:MAG: zinc transporter ZupT [Candidatus Woesearchaeota archaeon]